MTDLNLLGQKAVKAKYEMQLLDTEVKNRALQKAAEQLIADTDAILAANEKDIRKGEEK